MSAFEIAVTPTHTKIARQRVGARNLAREPVSVTLAPFSSKSIVTFEDIPVTKIARRFLNINNPSDVELTLTVSHSINSEFGLTFEWSTKIIPSFSTATMEIVWSPKNEIKRTDKIRLVDNRSFEKEVSFIFKSIDANKNTKKVSTVATKAPMNGAQKLKMKPPVAPAQKRLKLTIPKPLAANIPMDSKSKKVAVTDLRLPLRDINVLKQNNDVNKKITLAKQ